MIEWRLQPQDVARIKFAFSPMLELVLSLVTLQAPGGSGLHLPWVRATRSVVTELDLAEVLALVSPHGAPDFLTPAPLEPQPDIAAEFEVVRQTDPQHVVADVAKVPGVPAEVAERIGADPQAALARIVDVLELYWKLALAEHWPHILRLLEADVLWRAQRLATGGLHTVFEDLHDRVTFSGDRLIAECDDVRTGCIGLTGSGLTLAPHAMGWPRIFYLVEAQQPMIAYPVRGVATLWESEPPVPPDGMAALIGRTRARILATLAEPSSTTALARRMRLTPGAISQHLSVLHSCGLVSRTRVAGSVLYRRTHRGDALVE